MAGRVKVMDLAKELGVTSKDLVVALEGMGHKSMRATSPLTVPMANELRLKLGGGRDLPAEAKPKRVPKSKETAAPAEGDVLTPSKKLETGGVTRRVLVDHCSIHGATDEGLNTWGRVEDATFRWCLIADAAPPHSKGWLSGESCDRITIHHCLLAFCDDRNPKLEGGHYQVVNNVFAGWRNNNAMKLRLGARVNLVGNVFLPGPASDGSKGCVFIEEPAGELRLFMEDNLLLNAPAANDAWSLVTLHQQGPGGWTARRPAPERFRVREPFAAPDLKALPSSTVLDEVLDHAGAAPRDARDARDP